MFRPSFIFVAKVLAVAFALFLVILLPMINAKAATFPGDNNVYFSSPNGSFEKKLIAVRKEMPVLYTETSALTTTQYLLHLPLVLKHDSSSFLAKPKLLFPADGSLETQPTFDWTDVISATDYQFQLSATDVFTNLIMDETVTESQFTLPIYLDGFYYWRVYALNGSSYGAYSEVRSVQLSPLEPPVLLAPDDKSSQAQPTFDWTDVISATGYQFQLSTTDAFTDLVINQNVTDSQFTFTSIQTTTHYWRVYATKGAVSSPYSEIRSLQLVEYGGDEDGDSLPNGWELHGYDANDDGTIDIDLPALGADYLYKDVFVEMDYMERESATNGIAPSQTVMDEIAEIFRNAPVANPNGVSGINLHLELDDLIPYDDNWPWDGGKVQEFFQAKSANFSSTRVPVYHYMIWGNKYGSNNADLPYAIGYSRRVPGQDFFVTLGHFNNNQGGTDAQKVSAFVHEFGHNLGFRHGGSNDRNYKPNYFSVMNYWWAIEGTLRNGDYVVDYQRFVLPPLNERNLDETIGLDGGGVLAGYSTSYYCPNGSVRTVPAAGSIDWNCDGDSNDSGIKVDLNDDGNLQSLDSQNDWDNIVYHGGNVIGR